MKFAVLSDIHYISPKTVNGTSGERYYRHKICRAALYQAAAEDTDTLLITGDLVDNGDMVSHLEFIELLRQLKKDTGKNIYVINATHDYHFNKMYVKKEGEELKVKSEPWEAPYFDKDSADYRAIVRDEYKNLSDEEIAPSLFETATREMLWDMYYEFGPQQAVSTLPEGSSYCIELDDKTLVLMLHDGYRNAEALNKHNPNMDPAVFPWAKKIIDEAKSEGKFVFSCSHHPLVPPAPAYHIGAGERNMPLPLLGHTLADIGINLAFTGHTHFSNIRFGKSEKGNTICNITTPAVRNYPPEYRVVDLDAENGIIDVKSVPVEFDEPELTGGLSLFEFYHRGMVKEYYNIVRQIKKPFGEIITNLKLGDLYFLVKGSAGLTKAEYKYLKNKNLFDVLSTAAFNMVGGDGDYTPNTPEYKYLMGLAATLDSLCDAQPFINVRKKLMGYTFTDIIEPLLYNKSISDKNAKFDFTVYPDVPETPEFKSNAGDVLIAILTAIAAIFSPLAVPASIVSIPVASALKRKKLKTNPPQKPQF